MFAVIGHASVVSRHVVFILFSLSLNDSNELFTVSHICLRVHLLQQKPPLYISIGLYHTKTRRWELAYCSNVAFEYTYGQRGPVVHGSLIIIISIVNNNKHYLFAITLKNVNVIFPRGVSNTYTTHLTT